MHVLTEEQREFLSALFSRYAPDLKAAAKRYLKHSEDAEDTVMDFFEYMMRHPEKFETISPEILPYYLLTCLKRRCITRLQKKKRWLKRFPVSPEKEQTLSKAADPLTDAETEALRHVEYEQMYLAMQRLPEQQQDILRYRYLLNLEEAEIARAMGIQKKSVWTYLKRAKAALKTILQEAEPSAPGDEPEA